MILIVSFVLVPRLAPWGIALTVGLYARAAVDSRGGCSGEQPYK